MFASANRKSTDFSDAPAGKACRTWCGIWYVAENPNNSHWMPQLWPCNSLNPLRSNYQSSHLQQVSTSQGKYASVVTSVRDCTGPDDRTQRLVSIISSLVVRFRVADMFQYAKGLAAAGAKGCFAQQSPVLPTYDWVSAQSDVPSEVGCSSERCLKTALLMANWSCIDCLHSSITWFFRVEYFFISMHMEYSSNFQMLFYINEILSRMYLAT